MTRCPVCRYEGEPFPRYLGPRVIDRQHVCPSCRVLFASLEGWQQPEPESEVKTCPASSTAPVAEDTTNSTSRASDAPASIHVPSVAGEGQTDTPRTNLLWSNIFGPEEDWTPNQRKAADLARTLERELADTEASRQQYIAEFHAQDRENDRLERLLAAALRERDEARGRANREHEDWQSAIRLAGRLESERDELRAEVERLKHRIELLNTELRRWNDKTAFVQEDYDAGKLPDVCIGDHRADVLAALVQSLRAALARERERTAEAKRDTERLDWLENEQHLFGINATVGGWSFSFSSRQPIFVNNGSAGLRSAIDAALAETEPKAE